MNIVVLTENRKIEYLDLPSGTDAEEFVADRYSLLEIEWGVYEEEEVVYNDCQLCIDGVHVNESTIDNIIKQDNLMAQMEQASKQMEQDGL
jgi:hypothetical protein